MIRAFKNYDVNHDGKMDKAEFTSALKDMGHAEIAGNDDLV